MPKLFKTTVLGVGPYCVEFEDGEIIHTRSQERQLLIAAAPEMLEVMKHAAEQLEYPHAYNAAVSTELRAAIAKAEGKE